MTFNRMAFSKTTFVRKSVVGMTFTQLAFGRMTLTG
jgi:hypothetical protein